MDYAPPPIELVQAAMVQQAVPRVCCERLTGAILVSVPPARAPEIAEREEFDAACAAGTVAALHLFIERHPQSRWRAEAQSRLDALLNAKPQR